MRCWPAFAPVLLAMFTQQCPLKLCGNDWTSNVIARSLRSIDIWLAHPHWSRLRRAQALGPYGPTRTAAMCAAQRAELDDRTTARTVPNTRRVSLQPASFSRACRASSAPRESPLISIETAWSIDALAFAVPECLLRSW